MTKSILLAAALLALPAIAWSQDRPRPAPPAAAPVAAPAPVAVGGWTLEVRSDWVIGRIHRAQDEHDLDDAEAARIYKEVGANSDHAKLIATRHTLTAAEITAHETRLDTVVSQIHGLRQTAFRPPW
jgi:hypothetical protein